MTAITLIVRVVMQSSAFPLTRMCTSILIRHGQFRDVLARGVDVVGIGSRGWKVYCIRLAHTHCVSQLQVSKGYTASAEEEQLRLCPCFLRAAWQQFMRGIRSDCLLLIRCNVHCMFAGVYTAGVCKPDGQILPVKGSTICCSIDERIRKRRATVPNLHGLSG